jgi:hypothetical protein
MSVKSNTKDDRFCGRNKVWALFDRTSLAHSHGGPRPIRQTRGFFLNGAGEAGARAGVSCGLRATLIPRLA